MMLVQRWGLYCCMLILVFTSCIKEDLEICLPQTIRVSFTFVPSVECVEEPIIPSEINRLTVFIFDQYGRFVQQADTIPAGTDYQMELSLIPAHYQFVAVAGYGDDQLRTAPFVPGVTNIQDVSVSSYLEHGDGSLGSADQVLYMGADTLTIMPETQDQELGITMIQQTRVLSVTLDGITNSQYQIAIAGNAAQYTFKMKQIYLTGNPLIYVPIYEDANGLLGGTTLVNWPLKNEGDNTRLQVLNPATGVRVVDEDLLELLLRVPDIDLDCSTGFNIEILYRNNVGLSIYIENWKVYDGGYILI